MAGDWLKMEAATPDKPEVLAITGRMGWDDPDLTVGKLFRIWRWFDQQTTDGNAPGVTKSLLDRIAGVSGFADAMESIGWLAANDAGITLPNFEKHCGKTAKGRAQTAKRVAEHKASQRSSSDNAEGNAATVTKALPREEKRRVKNTSAKADMPDGFVRFWAAWPKTERKTAKAQCLAKWKQRGLEARADELIARVVSLKSTKQWLDGFEPAPLTYLHQGRYDDDSPPGSAKVVAYEGAK